MGERAATTGAPDPSTVAEIPLPDQPRRTPRVIAVLILLPPSEGKTPPRRGKPLDLATLAFPALTETRSTVVQHLVDLCRRDPQSAATVLGLGPKQLDLVERNADLLTAPTARADAVYTGVLYDALDVATLSSAAKRRATTRVATASALFGLLSPADRIPAYRLSGDATVPGLGPLSGVWRPVLGEAVASRLGDGLLVDLRSGMYANLWRPGPEMAPRVAGVRVLHEHGGQRKVVSHFNKATKGRLVRALLEAGATPRTPAELAATLRDLGWHVEEKAAARGKAIELDVVVSQV